MTREETWKQFVANYDIEVPEERIESEIHLICMDLRHRMRYDTMSGGRLHPFPEMELEQQKEEIREAAVFEVKSELVMKALLAQHTFAVTREELDAEAEAVALRQNTTVEKIKGFFGEDLAMLERDVRERKAMDWVCGNYT